MDKFSIFYAVQGFSPRRGHFVTLFAPYHTEDDAARKMRSLQEQNPQLKYRVNCLREFPNGPFAR